MQASKEYVATTPSASTAMRSRKLLCHALLAAAVLPATGSTGADAGTSTDEDSQSLLIIPAATCRTAPARNNPRKRASMSEIFNVGSSTTSIVVTPSTGTTFGALQNWATNAGGFSSLDRWSGGDFDGDGDQDLIAAWNNGGSTALAIRRATGLSFVTSHLPIPSVAWSAETIWVPGNFDNDADTDLAAIRHHGTSTSIDVYFSTGAGFASPVRLVNQGTPWASNTKWSVGDFNADGKDDLVSVANISGLTATVWLTNSNATAFLPSAWSNVGGWSDSSVYVAGDFTGDGKADLAGVWNNGGTIAIAMYPSTGAAFSYPGQWLTSNSWFSIDHRWVAGDFNADGKIDLGQGWENDGVTFLTAYTSSGSAFAYAFSASGGTGSWKHEASICAGVFDAS